MNVDRLWRLKQADQVALPFVKEQLDRIAFRGPIFYKELLKKPGSLGKLAVGIGRLYSTNSLTESNCAELIRTVESAQNVLGERRRPREEKLIETSLIRVSESMTCDSSEFSERSDEFSERSDVSFSSPVYPVSLKNVFFPFFLAEVVLKKVASLIAASYRQSRKKIAKAGGYYLSWGLLTLATGAMNLFIAQPLYFLAGVCNHIGGMLEGILQLGWGLCNGIYEAFKAPRGAGWKAFGAAIKPGLVGLALNSIRLVGDAVVGGLCYGLSVATGGVAAPFLVPAASVIQSSIISATATQLGITFGMLAVQGAVSQAVSRSIGAFLNWMRKGTSRLFNVIIGRNEAVDRRGIELGEYSETEFSQNSSLLKIEPQPPAVRFKPKEVSEDKRSSSFSCQKTRSSDFGLEILLNKDSSPGIFGRRQVRSTIEQKPIPVPVALNFKAGS